MNNDELDRLLKSSKVPDRTEEYWRDFPKKVSAKLHWQANASTGSRDARPIRPRTSFFAWAAGMAAVCLAVVFFLKFEKRPDAGATSQTGGGQLAQARKCYQELESLFPNQLQAIVFDQNGPRFLLSSQPDVPATPPLYLKICGPKGCEGVVTFSGQQIPFNGEDCEVLSNGSGRVLLVGSHRVWSENEPGEPVKIEAQSLQAEL